MTPNIKILQKANINDYLTIEEAEFYIGMSREVIRNYLYLGRFTKYLFKKNVLLSKKELTKYKEK